MRNFFAALLVISLSLASLSTLAEEVEGEHGKVLVFSDVDDTIKISYVRDRLEMVSFSVFYDSLFYGMNSVYQGVAATTGARFHYVSNGWKPTVAQTHQTLLKDFNFPNRENFYARKLKKILKKFPHKLSTITSIAMKENANTVVLIGDNGENDPKTYRDIEYNLEQYFKSRGKNIKVFTYIHTVYQPKDLYPGQQAFANAAELAVQLAENNLIDKTVAKSIVADVVDRIHTEGKNRVYGPLVNPFFKYVNKSADSILCRSFYSL